MCDFVSWLEVKTEEEKPVVVFLTDDDVFNTERGRELREYTSSKSDLLGHGSINFFMRWPDSKLNATRFECADLSTPDNFPKEVVNAIVQGKMKKLSEYGNYQELLRLLQVSARTNINLSNIDNLEKYLNFKSHTPESLKLEVIEKLKRVMKNGEGGLYETDYGGRGFLTTFRWSGTPEGDNYWEHVNSFLTDDTVEITKPSVQIIWELFSNPENRSEAWKNAGTND